MTNYKYIIGIDEVGRGPVAGPVAVGAVVVLTENIEEVVRTFGVFKDSKKMTPKKRNEWFLNINQAKKNALLDYKVIFVDNKNIDKFGIARSIKTCISKSLKNIQNQQGLNTCIPSECFVLLDGGLKAPTEYVNQKTIIKGDEKELLIALASIVAKVTRDVLMCNFAKKYPEYGFEKHKGYGTKFHMETIKKNGMSELHRKSFLTKLL